MKSRIFNLCILGVALCMTGCMKDPGNPSLTADKTAISVNEQVTFTLSGAENYTCIKWMMDGDSGNFTIVSGGSEDDLAMTVLFTTAGSYNVEASVKNCKNGDDGCTGKCRDESATISVSVE